VFIDKRMRRSDNQLLNWPLDLCCCDQWVGTRATVREHY
jgi:hypothetical protein